MEGNEEGAEGGRGKLNEGGGGRVMRTGRG